VIVMKDELETTMRLLGMTDLSQAHPRFLNTCDIDHLVPKSLDMEIEDRARPIPLARL
jgi:L-lactate dehydrogenase (cytochrome)